MKLTFNAFFVLVVASCSSNIAVVDPPPTPAVPPVFGGTAVAAITPPPPLSGGTVRILKTSDAAYAFVSDPDEDSVHIVSMGTSPALVGTIALEPGDNPNRVVGDTSGRAHVVLRGGGAIATIDLASATLVTRRTVCPAPRGIDYDALTDTVYVACATGELVALPSVGPIKRTVVVDRDLRDVVVDQGQVYVSRFRSAELLTLASDGSVSTRTKPPMPASVGTPMEAVVAWRTAVLPGGGTAMLHQLATNQPLNVVPRSTYYAEAGGPIVLSALTIAGSTTLTVNAAIDITFDQSGTPEVLSVDGNVQVGAQAVALDPRATDNATFSGIDDGNRLGVPWVVVQRRAPASALLVYSVLTPGTLSPTFTVPLSEVSHVDTGFDIFHLPTVVGTACMSCHPEGGDDSHAWTFTFKDASGATTETRLRRTQSLLGGAVTGTAPYHWDGDLADLQALSDEVFTHRMGGGQITLAQAPILARWLNAIPSPPARNDLDPARVASGQATFFGVGGCAACHAGPRGTLVANQDIGKTDLLGSSKALQVPMLLGVGNRAPFMHDGCAATLMARFTDVACGGSKHGNFGSLGTSDVQDLATYLESL